MVNMQVNYECVEWDSIENLICCLTYKVENLPHDLKIKAIKLLQKKLLFDVNKIKQEPIDEFKVKNAISSSSIKITKTSKILKLDNDYRKSIDDLISFKTDNKLNEEVNCKIFEDYCVDDLKDGLNICLINSYDQNNCKIKNEEDHKCDMEEKLYYGTENSIDVVSDNYSVDNEVCKFLCEKCAFIGSSINEFNKHKKMDHDIKTERICNTCGVVLPNYRQLLAHLAAHNQQVDANNLEYSRHYVCELCGAELRSKSIFMEHIGRHFNRQRKSCDICGKLFPNSSQLNAHKKNHDPPKVPCFVCDKKFRNKHKLRIHLLIHTGQRDYACPQCPYTSYVKHNLQKHCTKRHKLFYPPVRQSIKRFHPDEVETSMLNDPIARSHIDKLRISGDCYPISINLGTNFKDICGGDITHQINNLEDYDSSELNISNQVEIKSNTITKSKLREGKL